MCCADGFLVDRIRVLKRFLKSGLRRYVFKTRSRIKQKSSNETLGTESEQILIFPAMSLVPIWTDDSFIISTKSDNNFQDNPNSTMRVHLHMGTWIWSVAKGVQMS
jgi:hypothetical protein